MKKLKTPSILGFIILSMFAFSNSSVSDYAQDEKALEIETTEVVNMAEIDKTAVAEFVSPFRWICRARLEQGGRQFDGPNKNGRTRGAATSAAVSAATKGYPSAAIVCVICEDTLR